MDLKEVIVSAAREVLDGVTEAKAALKGTLGIEFPSRIEFEVGINGAFELANFDEPRNGTIRFSIPINPENEEPVKVESPASSSLEQTKPVRKKK